MTRIEIVVSTDGQTQVEAFGYTGASCRVATKVFEQALGNTTAENLKADFYEKVQTQNHQKEEL